MLHQTSSCLTSSFVGRLIIVFDEPCDSAVVRKHRDVVAVMFSDTDVGEQCVQRKTRYTTLWGFWRSGWLRRMICGGLWLRSHQISTQLNTSVQEVWTGLLEGTVLHHHQNSNWGKCLLDIFPPGQLQRNSLTRHFEAVLMSPRWLTDHNFILYLFDGRKATKENLTETASGITESLMSISRLMAQQVKQSEETIGTLGKSTQLSVIIYYI